MYIIEASDERSSWVSGIFKDEQKATDYFNSIPNELRVIQTIVETPLEFPFYIIESNRTFSYMDKDGMIKAMKGIVRVEDQDHVYFNIYSIESDYFSMKSGTDYMGTLNHDHIDNSFLDWFEKEGEDFLKRRRIL
ncbi:hypothetical protein GE107_00050 [Cohnella sp. CFH 77786]|uniref:hypothetical protein n=1 Tax=Cohnella sp. CFH 77786 TaxID=2662265 RepID=UPI001C61082F|nr:hypothetical protein [Cohnella sp. CFH 77786]MBW5444454.1 hypothetical protein [Cohnella sp. CFH 77786]